MNETSENEITAAKIVKAIGRQELAAELQVGLTAISNASVAGSFPAAWYNKINVLCKAVGMECPVELFNWR